MAPSTTTIKPSVRRLRALGEKRFAASLEILAEDIRRDRALHRAFKTVLLDHLRFVATFKAFERDPVHGPPRRRKR